MLPFDRKALAASQKAASMKAATIGVTEEAAGTNRGGSSENSDHSATAIRIEENLRLKNLTDLDI